jgi:hypothetical protein
MWQRVRRLLRRLRLAALYGPAWVDTLKEIHSLPEQDYEPAEHS